MTTNLPLRRLPALLDEFVLYRSADPAQEALFQRHANTVCRQFCSLLLAVIIVAQFVFGPADPLIYDQPFLGAMLRARLGGCVGWVGALLLFRYATWAADHAALVVGVCMVLVCGWVGWCFGQAGGIEHPPFYVLWATIPISCVVFTTFGKRLGLNLLIAVAWSGAFLLPHPEHLEAPLIVGALAFTSFVAVFATVGGHGVYHLLRLNWYQKAALDAERARSERLLLNVLPASIAPRLKNEERPIAEGYDDVSVLFADMVGFTAWAEQIDPKRMVSMLDRLFREFDELAEKHGLEKIKTIGDAYMLAAGVPERRDDHAPAIAAMALDMLAAADRLQGEGPPLQLRIGIHSGPAVGGVIGSHKFIYDLWGDTVNIASRMESHGLAGSIQVTRPTRDRIAHAFELEERGTIDVKGKGPTATWLLRGPRETAE